MNIIKLTGNDTSRFLELREISLTQESDNFRTSALDNSSLGFDYWQDRIERDHVAAVEVDGVLKALGGLSRVVGEKMDHKGLIWGMYVHPDLRGSGAADLIMDALIATAQEHLRQLILTLAADNASAQRFYQRHGFALYGTEPDAIRRGDGFVGEALMWRPL
ncbi:GNAT family N-acetyltransferase [Sphingorhabdus sp.]|jgi:ribosomal protein S18 acetylase RimI-like enzyme|uniref:GNAT family N-acetyltransferase n=1 Tax=Sphingorhabdus sp. TaxID=1902408 RepID=UPI0037C581CB